MIKKLLIALTLLLVVPVIARGHKITSNLGTVKNSYNFLFARPDSIESKHSKPLVVFLHGASLCGNNLDRVRRYGTIDALEKGRDIDAYVLAPQNPGGAWKPEKIMNLIEWAEANYNIDSDRIYVMGMSLGGYGTIDMAATYPDRIAAAIAMCGGASVRNLEGLADVPLWIIHGTADCAVNVSQSDKVVEAIKGTDSKGERLFYDRIPGMNHSQPARMFYLPESYDWLFQHSLADENRDIADTFSLNGNVLRNAYAGLKHSNRSASLKSKRKTSKSTMAKKSGSKRKKNSKRSRA